jgi:inhibitor of cysteine peptidase
VHFSGWEQDAFILTHNQPLLVQKSTTNLLDFTNPCSERMVPPAISQHEVGMRSRVRSCGLVVFLLMFSILVTPAKTLLLDDSDVNSHICLYVGDTLTLKLSSNPSTGYSWGKPDNLLHFRLIASKAQHGSSTNLGAHGFQLFTWHATEPGESSLALNYFRPFEKNSPPMKTFHLSFTVEPRPETKPFATAKP